MYQGEYGNNSFYSACVPNYTFNFSTTFKEIGFVKDMIACNSYDLSKCSSISGNVLTYYTRVTNTSTGCAEYQEVQNTTLTECPTGSCTILGSQMTRLGERQIIYTSDYLYYYNYETNGSLTYSRSLSTFGGLVYYPNSTTPIMHPPIVDHLLV